MTGGSPAGPVQRIGIMGGTFDPIHYGHLLLAEQAREQLGLDRVLFITASDPPHKVGNGITPVEHRHAMVCLATQDNDSFEPSTIEIDRPGPSYTIDTLRQIQGLFGAGVCVYLLMGADEAASLMSWRDPYEIQKMATIVVANRPGQSMAETLAVLPEDFMRLVCPVEIPGVDISSTGIRERVREGKSIRYLTTDAVMGYILKERLYRG